MVLTPFFRRLHVAHALDRPGTPTIVAGCAVLLRAGPE